MKKINRNNADINKMLNKKVAVICDTEEKELDFRKWAKQYVNCVDDEYTYTNCYYFFNPSEDVCLLLRNDGIKWEYVESFKNSDYSIVEWEIAEKQKTYTIKDVVENEGKIYQTTTNSCIYKYCKSNLYYKYIWKMSNPWKKTELNIGEIVKLKFIEYTPELKKITFEEALKEMETKVCRCLFSNRRITIDGSQFVDASNGEYTKLALPEIKGEWVVIEE